VKAITLTVNGEAREFQLVDLEVDRARLRSFNPSRLEQGLHRAEQEEFAAIIELIAKSENDGLTNKTRVERLGRYLLRERLQADASPKEIVVELKKSKFRRPRGNPNVRQKTGN
jgi:hypothetical protein